MRLQTLLALPILFASLGAHARCDSRAECAALDAAVLDSRALRTVNDPTLIRLLDAGNAAEAYARALELLDGGAAVLTRARPAPDVVEAQLRRLLAAESSPFAALVDRVAEHLCEDGCAAQAERLVRESGLLQRALINDGLDPASLPDAVDRWISDADEPADSVIDRAAWIVIAEDSFKTAAGFEDGTHRADMEAAALMLSGGATVAMDVAQPTCGDHGLDGPGDLFGGCGMPDAPQLPDMGGAGPDPVPTAQTRRGAGPSPAQRTVPRQVGSWDMPGGCYGLDPSKIFDGAGQPEGDEGGESDGDAQADPPRQPSVMDKTPPEEESPKTALPPEGSKAPADAPSDFEQLEETFTALYEATKIPIGGGATFDLLESAGWSGKQTVIDGQPGFKLQVSFRPTPDGDAMSGICGERFAAVMAGCLGVDDPGAPEGRNRAFNLVCGDSLAPVLTEDPKPAGCGCIGVDGEAPGGDDGGGDGGGDAQGESNDVGEMECCPAFCFVASNSGYDSGDFGACGACTMGPECGAADASTGGLVEACAAGLGEPIHSQLCGAVDPSPLQMWFGEPAAFIAEPAQRRAP